MEELNLAAADRWRKEHGHPLDTSELPPSASVQESSRVLAYLEAINGRSIRTREGIALVLGAAYPGAGPLFMGAYLFAILYFAAFAVCGYMAVSNIDILKARWISWPWFWGGVAVWVVSFVHTSILTAQEE